VRDGDSVGGEAMRALHVADLGTEVSKNNSGPYNYATYKALRNTQLRTNITP
jgi:hypothetical protein